MHGDSHAMPLVGVLPQSPFLQASPVGYGVPSCLSVKDSSCYLNPSAYHKRPIKHNGTEGQKPSVPFILLCGAFCYRIRGTQSQSIKRSEAAF